jgi:GNAT superfamily N-acetyltransferase
VTLRVETTTAEVIVPLRQAVLRPGLPVEASRYPEDDAAVHVAAWDDGEVVGCASVFPQAWAGVADAASPWRLRGMAVTPSRQGSGVGGKVLARAVAAARAGGADVIWANARSAALAFYLRHGWQIAGDEFVTPDTGLPHHPIVLR